MRTSARGTLERSGATGRDAAIGLVLFVLLAVEAAISSAVQYPLTDLALLAVACAATAWRVAHPILALAVTSLALLAMTFGADSVTDFAMTLPLVAVAAYAVGAFGDRGTGALAVLALSLLVVAVNAHGDTTMVEDYVFPISVIGGSWAVGRLIQSRTALRAELESRRARLERDREELAQAAVSEERSRLARELHDVVAHSISVMVVQAGAARRVLDRAPDESLASLANVEHTGRDALSELRRILDVLRPGDEPATLQPAPSLERIGELVERARAAGMPVDLHVTGLPGSLPSTTHLTAYRVVQEALTNSLKHAARGHATVSIAWSDEAVTVDVTDSGGPKRARAAVPSAPGGHGLLGMRERVILVGGELTTGPVPGGGFRVHARLPRTTPDPDLIKPKAQEAATA